MDSWQEKQNNADDSANTKVTNNDEMVETSIRDDEQTETLDLDYEQRAEDGKMRSETPKKDNDLPGVQLATDDLNGHHEQMQEIKLDWQAQCHPVQISLPPRSVYLWSDHTVPVGGSTEGGLSFEIPRFPPVPTFPLWFPEFFLLPLLGLHVVSSLRFIIWEEKRSKL